MNIEQLRANKHEHYKFARELSLIYPEDINHKKRVRIENAINSIEAEIDEIIKSKQNYEKNRSTFKQRI